MIKLKCPKSMIITIIIFMMLFSIIFSGCLADILLFPYKNIINNNKSSPLPTSTPDGLPLYDCMNMGTAKKLLGNCVFINIFLSDEKSSFSDEEKQEVMTKIKDMDTFLNDRIKEYNKDLTIIYNLDDLSIDYNVDFIVPVDMNMTNWGYDIIADIYSLYDINSIMEKYDADNFAFFININKIGRSYAKIKSYRYSDLYDNEFGIMFAEYLDSAKKRFSYSYTHEALHLFGAIDLYYPYNPDDKRLSLAKEYFPKDIMSERFDNIYKSTIDNLTAYLIGWDDHLEEKYEIFLEEYKIK